MPKCAKPARLSISMQNRLWTPLQSLDELFLHRNTNVLKTITTAALTTKGIERYEQYCREYNAYMQTDAAKQKVMFFDQQFPNADITEVKKVDFILWQER